MIIIYPLIDYFTVLLFNLILSSRLYRFMFAYKFWTFIILSNSAYLLL